MRCLLTGVARRDNILRSFARGSGAEFGDSLDPLPEETPVFIGLAQNCDNLIMGCREAGREFWYIDHAYFNRGYEGGAFRVIRSGLHQSALKDVDGSRTRVKLKPWRAGDEIVVIVPSPKLQKIYNVPDWHGRVWRELKNHTDRKIVIKHKNDEKPLREYLKTAHAVVSFASVSEVEAAVEGVPVFTSEFSPAAPISEKDFTRIESPIYPDRERWLNTLFYSQFHITEMARGEAWRILNGA